jgi:excisionase family DNA binding protein
MKVRPIPANVLNGFCTTLDTYIPGVTPTVFVAAFLAYGADAPAADPAARRSLSLRESGRALGLSEWTVRRMVLDGRIRGRKIGSQWRVPVTEIEALASGAAPAAEA